MSRNLGTTEPVAATGPTPCGYAGFSPGSGIMWESAAELERDLDDIVSVGAQWVRLDFGWASMEPKKGSYNWSNTDRVLDAALIRGLKVVAILHETPAWARAAGTDNVFYPPTNPADYVNFAGVAVERYKSKVKVWEIWNEPNNRPFWYPQPDVAAFTALLKGAYPAIKNADPAATVILGGLSPAVDASTGSQISPGTFLRRVYENGGKGSFDAVGIHPYSFPARPIDPTTKDWNTFQRLPIFYDLMVRNGDGDKKIWLTEYGSATGTGPDAVTESEQAAEITDAFYAVAQLPWVSTLFVYSGRDAGTDLNDREHNFGIRRRDFAAKPSRAAFKDAAAACLPQQPASLAVSDATVVEGDSGATSATFTVTRRGDIAATSSVRFSTVDGTATAPGDYTAVSGAALSFASGETTKTLTVAVTGDTASEARETFSVKLSSPTGAGVSDDTGVATIVDDEVAPSLAVRDVSTVEGNSGATSLTFTVTRSGNASGTSSVTYSTADGSAVSPADFTALAPTTVTFAPGETAKAVTVAVAGEAAFEPDESLSMKLSSPSGATVSDDSAVGTILNDDEVGTYLSVADTSVTEGTLLGSTITFTISRSGNLNTATSVQYATANGTATAGVDYTAVPLATANFAAGEAAKTVSVAVAGDLEAEPNETVLLNLSSPVGAAVTDAQGVATIVDDDNLLGLLSTPAPATFFNVFGASVVEGDSGTRVATFNVVRSGVTVEPSSVQFATADGSAKAGEDFAGRSPTTLNFAAGETAKAVTVTVNGDTEAEAIETFAVKLSSPTGAVIADDEGLGTVFNDDTLPTISIGDATVVEGNGGTTSAVFTLSRTGPAAAGASVQFATAGGSATAGADFVAAATTVEFAPGDTARTVTVAVNGDTIAEANETFTASLSLPAGVTLADATGVGTVIDDDAAPEISVTDVVARGSETDSWALLTVSRSGDTSGTSSVKYATADGTATAGSSYVGIAPTTLTFAPEERVKQVEVRLKAQSSPGTGSFALNLSSPTGAAISDGSGSSEVAPKPYTGSRYNPLSPARILDTRSAIGAPAAKVGAGASIDVAVTGRGGVPATGVSAVVLNLTATSPSTTGFAIAWPTGEARPNVSNLNFVTNATVANLATVKVGAGGKVSLYNSAGTTHYLADVAGWYDDGTAATGTRYHPLSPARILDTRSAIGAPAAKVGAGASIDVAVTGRGGVPASGVSAVALTLTATNPTATGFAIAWPTGEARPNVSNINFVSNRAVANLANVKVGAGGKVSLYNSAGNTHYLVDVAGWYDDGTAGTGTRYHPLSPARVLDTRSAIGAPAAKVGAGASIDVAVTGRGGVPASGVSAVVLNLTATNTTATGFAIDWPTGEARPNTSNLNFVANATVAILATVKVGAGGKVSLYNSAGTTHYLADVAGWYDIE